MISASYLFVLSIVVFSFLAVFLSLEGRRGKRWIFSGLRDFLDRIIVRIANFFSYWFKYIGRHIIKLSWYYSLHRFLRLILTILVKIYDNLETIFLNNRNRAKIIKKEKKEMSEKNHLHLISDHKQDTTLTPDEKKRLLTKKLKGE